MGAYDGQTVKALIEELQEPIKSVLRNIGNGKLTPKDAYTCLKILRGFSEITAPTEDSVTHPNAKIMVRIRDRIYQHLDPDFLASYWFIFDRIFTIIIIKVLDYD